MIDYLINYFQNGSSLLKDEKALRKTGFWGYFLGTFSLFISLRLAEAAAGSYISFLFFFALILMLNYAESAVTALFLDMLGHKGSPSFLFYLFGFSQMVWLFLPPLIFVAKFSNLSLSLFFFGVFLGVILLRLRLIKEAFGVRYKMAMLSFLAPYLLVYLFSMFFFMYSIYWLLALLS